MNEIEWLVSMHQGPSGITAKLMAWNETSSRFEDLVNGTGVYHQLTESVANCSSSGPLGSAGALAIASFDAATDALVEPVAVNASASSTYVEGEIVWIGHTDYRAFDFTRPPASLFTTENLTLGTNATVNGTFFSPGRRVSLFLNGTPAGAPVAGNEGQFTFNISVAGVSQANNLILLAVHELGVADAAYVNVLEAAVEDGGAGGATPRGAMGLGPEGIVWLVAATALGLTRALKRTRRGELRRTD
ncbi:MAG: hypothetical protein Kow0069_26810 [Promethearchaeota archaeon]